MNLIEKNEGANTRQGMAPSNINAYIPNIANKKEIGNPEAAAHFLKLIAEEEWVTFQTFDDVKGRLDSKLCHIFHGTLKQHLSRLTELNEHGAGIFFTVNETDLKGRKTENITKVRSLFVDLDGSPLEPVLSGPLEPHIVVQTSSQRFHAYWLIEELPLNSFSQAQKALIDRFNADKAVHDLPRVMRLPGFFHHKREPFLVEVIEWSGKPPYQSEFFLSKFGINLQASTVVKKPQLGLSQDPILQELDKRGMLKGPSSNKQGAWEISCPYKDSHTTGDRGTVYFEPYTNGYEGPGFKCQHTHCEGKKIEDLKEYLDLEVWGAPFQLKEELEPVAPFKEEMLPNILHEWIMDCAERMQVPPDFLAVTAIVVLGSLIGRKAGVFPKAHDDWLVTPNLWGAVVGRPSLLKTPAISEMMKPLEEMTTQAIQQYNAAMADHEKNQMMHQVLKANQKEEMKKALRDMPDKSDISKMSFPDGLEAISEPILKRYKTEDATVEKIGEILLQNPQGILIHRDELVGLLKKLDKPGHEGDRAFFLESWNGNGSYTVDRISRGTLHIPALCLSMIGGIQPGPLSTYVHQAATGGGGDDGLLQRFQLLVWPDAPNTWENIDRRPNKEAKEKAYNLFYQFDTFAPFEPSSNGAFETCTFHFSIEGQELFNEWRSKMEQKLRTGELSPALESHLAKYRSLMPSLALIFYLVETLGNAQKPTEIDAQAAKKAIQWCSYLETHAKRLYSSGEDPYMPSARALLRRIESGDLINGFSIRDVYYGKHWTRLDKPELVSNAVKILKEFGWVKTEEVKTIGRPSTKVIIHPQLRRPQ